MRGQKPNAKPMGVKEKALAVNLNCSYTVRNGSYFRIVLERVSEPVSRLASREFKIISVYGLIQLCVNLATLNLALHYAA